jgi:hypothetical protein
LAIKDQFGLMVARLGLFRHDWLEDEAMALQYLDTRLVGAYIVDAWQNHFNTEQDPADGQWFTNGPGNNGGLFGKLTDGLASELVFDASKQVFTTRLFSADSNIVDNRNGLQSKVSTTLTYQYSDSSSVTHSTTSGLKVGSSLKITNKTTLGVPATGANETTVEVAFSTEYSYSWTDTNTRTKTETQTVSRTTDLVVPKGKVYQQVLTCNKDNLTIPFHADIYLTGKSFACFRNPVNGQKIWEIDAGALCQWINQFGSAAEASSQYGRDPKQPERGVIALQGTMSAEQSRNFMVYTLDITDKYDPGQPSGLARQGKDIASISSGQVVNTVAVK